MRPSTNLSIQTQAKPRGFALVATLMLMLLLGILAVGMLSLSTVSLRGNTGNSAQQEAQANARMALMLAIAELQKNTGVDTRVTAPADIVEANAPPLTGVWKSWEGTNHNPDTGRPIKPDYSVKERSEADNGRFLTWLVSGAVPGANIATPSELVWTNTSPGASAPDDHIPLLDEGTLGEDKPGQVHVLPQLVYEQESPPSTERKVKGAQAWWVSPENQKARLIQPHEPRTDDAAGWSALAKSHTVPDPKTFGLESLNADLEVYTPDPDNPKSAGKALTLATTNFLNATAPAEPHQNFHNLSTSAVGLLTNTATGGWRKDLSILTEKWDQVYASYPDGKLPLFRFTPVVGSTSLVPKPTKPVQKGATTAATTAATKPPGSLFYPWSSYGDGDPTNPPINYRNPGTYHYPRQNGAVTSWQSLQDFATAYRQDVSYSSSTASVPLSWARTHRATPWGPSGGDTAWGAVNNNYGDWDLFNYLHETQYAPVLARVQWVFKVRARRQNYEPTNAQYNKFDVDLMVSPVYTLWNPYNVALNINDYFAVAMNKSFPMAIGFGKTGGALDYRRYINGSRYYSGSQGEYDNTLVGNYTNHWEQTNGQGAGFPTGISIGPGEVKSFSLAADAYPGQSGVMAVLKNGYDGAIPRGYVAVNGNNPRKPSRILTNFLPTDSLSIGMRFDNLTQMGDPAEEKNVGPGIQMSFGRWAGPDPANPTSAGNNRYLGDSYKTYSMLTNKDFATQYWKAPSLFPNYSVSEILVEPSDESGAYDSYNSGNNPPWTPLFSVVFGPRMSIGAGAGNPDDRPTKGVLVNNPFTTAALTTSESQWTNHPVNIPFDFSVHAHRKGGSETLPEDTASEGYLFTGFQNSEGLSRMIMTEVPLRPMSSLAELQHWNLQGNKAIPPFQYYIIGNSDASPLIQPDSILPQSPVSTNVAQNLQHDDAFCANHLLFDDWFLSSIAPAPADFGSSISKPIDAVYREYLRGERYLANRAYKPITSDKSITDLEATDRIDKILNSSDGWLKVASRFEVEGMFNVNSTSVAAWRALLGHARNRQVAYHAANGIDLDTTEYDHVVTRHTIASDVKASTDEGFGATFNSGSQYAGFRTLSDDQLDDLADKIVEQVRLRGPFLSLSEFVNRKLDEDEDVALAGAIQTALSNLADDPNEPLKDADLSSATMSPADPKLDGADYAFPEAAVGRNIFGFPGWIRQADVLRPIAPILSARDDTFTIRAYGDSRDEAGNVTARAWCEATIRRTRDFVDARDAADMVEPPSDVSSPNPNKLFGRRYEVVTFRWLSQDEV